MSPLVPDSRLVCHFFQVPGCCLPTSTLAWLLRMWCKSGLCLRARGWRENCPRGKCQDPPSHKIALRANGRVTLRKTLGLER